MFDDFTVFKEEVKNRIDIVDVIGEFVELKKRGVNYSGPCPFHNETKPSFNVNSERQFYHCFGCNKGGDVFSFLMDITGMSFLEALQQLAEGVGLQMPEKHAVDPSLKENTDIIIAANIATAEYFYRTLFEKDGKAGLTYLRDRGLSEETIKDFRLGFSPKESSGLLSFAKTKSIDQHALEKAGILKPNSYGGQPYNPFGGRIIFPIIDQTARIIGFGARLLEGEGAKYVNSSESPVYHKSNVLYGLYQAKKEIKRARTTVVVEGYMDVISLHQAGIKNAIAASGTAFTVEQGRIIGRMSRKITLLFDGDKAGLTAAARGADNLLASDLTIGVAVLPEGEDPDSYVMEHGAEALNKFIDDPMDIWEFKLSTLGSESPGPENSLKLAGEIADSIAQISDELKREVYIREMSKRIGIDIDAMRKAVNGRVKRKRYHKSDEKNGETPIMVKSDEKFLLASIIQYPELARHLMEEAGSKMFSSEILRAVIEGIFHRTVEGLDISPSALMNDYTEKQTQELIASVSMLSVSKDTARKYIDDNLKQFKLKELHAKREECSSQMALEKETKKKNALNKKKKEIEEKLKQIEQNT
ncbi:DNA primase [Candidatus Latescibacterota bacterium]